MSLLLLSGILTLFPTNIPIVSALGCFPDEFFRFEGPFRLSGEIKLDGIVQTRDGTLQKKILRRVEAGEINHSAPERH